MPDDYLMHHGVKGMKWGIQNGPPYPLQSRFDSPASMSNSMKKWSYKNYSRLQSPEETFRTKSGSCHDQVIFELQELRRLGYNPKATFLIETDETGQGGVTHSYVTYSDGKGKTVWFENAWSDKAGQHIFKNEKAVRSNIASMHKNGTLGDKQKYPNLIMVQFDEKDHSYGESLEEFVNACFDSPTKNRHKPVYQYK